MIARGTISTRPAPVTESAARPGIPMARSSSPSASKSPTVSASPNRSPKRPAPAPRLSETRNRLRAAAARRPELPPKSRVTDPASPMEDTRICGAPTARSSNPSPSKSPTASRSPQNAPSCAVPATFGLSRLISSKLMFAALLAPYAMIRFPRFSTQNGPVNTGQPPMCRVKIARSPKPSPLKSPLASSSPARSPTRPNDVALRSTKATGLARSPGVPPLRRIETPPALEATPRACPGVPIANIGRLLAVVSRRTDATARPLLWFAEGPFGAAPLSGSMKSAARSSPIGEPGNTWTAPARLNPLTGSPSTPIARSAHPSPSKSAAVMSEPKKSCASATPATPTTFWCTNWPLGRRPSSSLP